MGKVTGFHLDKKTGNITMYSGDTGSFWVHCSRGSGEDWPETARMLFTVRDGNGEIVIARLYRMDDQWDAGDGTVLIEFHNADTDQLPAGDYIMERRYNVAPIWDGTPGTARCVDYLTSSARMVEGATIRTVFRGTLHIDDVQGRI